MTHQWRVVLTQSVMIIANSKREAVKRAVAEHGGQATSAEDLGETQSQFVHECGMCRFLGSGFVGIRAYDYYVHEEDPVVLEARYGDSPADVYSRPLTSILAAIKKDGGDSLPEPISRAFDLYRESLKSGGESDEGGRE